MKLWSAGTYDSAQQLMYEAIDGCPRGLLKAQMLHALATRLLDLPADRERSCERAADLFREAYEMRVESLGPKNDVFASTIIDAGRALLTAAELAPETRKTIYLLRAKGVLERAVASLREGGVSISPSIALATASLSSVHAQLGEWDLAFLCAAEAKVMAFAMWPPEHPSHVTIDVNAATVVEAARKSGVEPWRLLSQHLQQHSRVAVGRER